MTPDGIAKTGEALAVKAALDQVAQEHASELSIAATQADGQREVEVAYQQQVGRLTLLGYGKAVFGLTKQYVLGGRGTWRFGK